jgi:hypothetical protein
MSQPDQRPTERYEINPPRTAPHIQVGASLDNGTYQTVSIRRMVENKIESRRLSDVSRAPAGPLW